MADNNDDILSQFQEFLAAKQQQEAENAAAEDHEIEVWTSDGRGAKARRSAFKKSVLEELGIGADPEPTEDESGDGTKPKAKAKTPAKTATSAASSGVARKYFMKPNS